MNFLHVFNSKLGKVSIMLQLYYYGHLQPFYNKALQPVHAISSIKLS
jgi:hypothetical protein